MIKQELMKNELVKQIGESDLRSSLEPALVHDEIKSLQEELQQISASVSQVDLKRRQIVIKRINQLFPQLVRAEKYEAYKSKLSEGKNLFQQQVGQEKFLNRSLEVAHVSERLNAGIESLDEKYEGSQPTKHR